MQGRKLYLVSSFPTPHALVMLPLLAATLLASAGAGAQTWSALGGGLNDWVWVQAVYNGELVVGGKFTMAGGVPANYIAKWNGISWAPLGSGMDGEVDALAVYNGELWAGGRFTTAGGVPVNYIARWDGSVWSEPEGGADSYVVALTVYNNRLIVGGYFTDLSGPANYIAQWDGAHWNPLGSGMGGAEGQVMALTSYGNDLIAAGFFSTAGGVSANRIARWNGVSWAPLGSGIDNVVYALTVYQGELIAGGLYSVAGGHSAHDVAMWNGTSWAPLGSGIGGGPYGYVLALAVHGQKLVAGGIFTTAGGVAAENIAEWDGSAWAPIGSGVSNGGATSGVFTLGEFGTDGVAGGIFIDAGGVGAANAARWSDTLLDVTSGVGQADRRLSVEPNPAPGAAVITFDQPRASVVQLAVYDLFGRKVQSLLDEEIAPGPQAVRWDGMDGRGEPATSGVYYILLNTPEQTDRRIVVLVH